MERLLNNKQIFNNKQILFRIIHQIYNIECKNIVSGLCSLLLILRLFRTLMIVVLHAYN